MEMKNEKKVPNLSKTHQIASKRSIRQAFFALKRGCCL
jgi:hypothetical protein